jgi:hypothetical protein
MFGSVVVHFVHLWVVHVAHPSREFVFGKFISGNVDDWRVLQVAVEAENLRSDNVAFEAIGYDPYFCIADCANQRAIGVFLVSGYLRVWSGYL